MVSMGRMEGYRRILVAVDGSPASLHALMQACRLPGARILVTRVAPREAERRAWEERLAAALAEARKAGAAAAPLLLFGEPHERLVAAAKAEDCDIIVVGLKGRDLPPQALMGSTTARTIGFAPMDVLVVPEHGVLGFSRLLLPTDGSRCSQGAARRAVDLCRAWLAELFVVAVLDAPPGFGEEDPEVARALKDRLLDLAAGVCRQGESQGVPCRAAVEEGAAWRVIVEAARRERADLIVIGSHGRTGLKRLLMGSVTERVLGFSPCPVLVVKEKA